MRQDVPAEPATPAAERADPAANPRDTLTLWLLTLGGGLLAALLVRLRLGADPDLWLHLRIGDELRAGEHFRRLPDPLVALADRPYSPTQWLAEVGMSVVHQIGGINGIHLVRALLVVVLLAFLQLTALTYTTAVRAAGVALPALFATAAQWAERPQLAGLVLLAVTTWLWSRARRDGSVPWLVVPLTWLWAMIHGSWLLGIGTNLLFLLAMLLEHPRRERAWGQLVAVVAGSVAVVALTPLGPSLLLNPLAVGAAARGRVNEWAAPGIANPLVLVIIAMAILVLVRSVRHLRARLPELLIATTGVVLALAAVRTIGFGAVLVVPALAAVLAPVTAPGEPVERRRLSPWPLVVTGAVLIAVPGVIYSARASGPLPPAVDAALAGLPPGAVVAVEPAASGWVVWEHPQVKPLRDLRAEVYSAPVADAYESFFDARPGWQAYATEHRVAALVLETGSPLDRAVSTGPEWRQAARSSDHVLWVRNS